MNRLSGIKIEIFSAAVADLYRTVTLETIGQDFNRTVESLIPAQYIGTNFFNTDNVISHFVANRELPREVCPEVLIKNQLQNPNIAYCHAQLSKPTRPKPFVTRWSDFTTMRQIKETSWYQESLRHFRPSDQLMLLCPNKPHIAVALTRQQGMFSGEEVAMLELLAPHFENALIQATTRAQIRESLEISGAAANSGAALVLDDSGNLLSATTQARNLMSLYFPKESNEKLPKVLTNWFNTDSAKITAFSLRNDYGHLTISYAGSATYRPWDFPLAVPDSTPTPRLITLLKVTEKPLSGTFSHLKQLGLTPAESEILYWLEMGKSNAEIGLIKGAAIGTVKKHLENIYRKLGVENRHAASTVARRVLGVC